MVEEANVAMTRRIIIRYSGTELTASKSASLPGPLKVPVKVSAVSCARSFGETPSRHKRIVPARESALGTNSLIQIHERPSVYPPLEGSAIKTDFTMDDGGIRPAVNQTTKFLVSASRDVLGTVLS